MNPYQEGTKIYEIYQRIILEPKLEILTKDDTKTHLYKCIKLTNQFQFLEDYIDEYLFLFPDKINERYYQEMTPLMIASRNSNTKSTENTVKILLDHKANPK